MNLLTRNVKKLSVGQIVYSSMCYENGSMFDDGTLLKMSDHGFRWVCGDELAEDEKKNYMDMIGLKDTGLSMLILKLFLNLKSFSLLVL